MNHYPEKSKLEIIFDTTYPVVEGINYTVSRGKEIVQKVGAVCNGFAYDWLFNPRNDDEINQDMELAKQEFDRIFTDKVTGSCAVITVSVVGFAAVKVLV